MKTAKETETKAEKQLAPVEAQAETAPSASSAITLDKMEKDSKSMAGRYLIAAKRARGVKGNETALTLAGKEVREFETVKDALRAKHSLAVLEAAENMRAAWAKLKAL
jgi:hypothetical protein